MTEVEKKIEEIDEQIESLKKENRELKKQLYAAIEKSYIKRMFSRLEIQVRHDDTVMLYCSVDDGFQDYDEIDKLCISFSNMQDSISSSLNSIVNYRINEEKLRYQLLQSQVFLHLLFQFL